MKIRSIFFVFALLILPACDSGPASGTSTGDSADEDPSDESTAVTFTSVTPTSGVVTGGTQVTILGTNFAAGITVTFGTAGCTSIVVNSTTELTCDTPAGTTGSASIVLTNADETTVTSTNAFTYGDVAPTFASVSPTNFINTKSTSLTISGTGFIDSGGNQSTVTIGAVSCGAVVINSASELTCNSPLGVAEGTADIVVTNPDAQAVTGAAAFSFRTPPTFTELNAGGAKGVFNAVCSACHGGSGGLTLSNYASASARVVAGSPTTSLIWQRINGIGNLMPQGGPMMAAPQIQYIEDWILDGAPNN